jgi:hypothetical protein
MLEMKNAPSRLAYTVKEAIDRLPFGRNKFYDEANAGRIKLRKCGHKTLVLASDLNNYLESLPVIGVNNK